MSAFKRSSLVLLSVSLALAFLLGIFAIIDASSAKAGQTELRENANQSPQTIIVSPSELTATLQPGGSLTQTLWITNTGVTPITFTIFELTGSVSQAGFAISPAALPVIDPGLRIQVSVQGRVLAIIFLRETPDLSLVYHIRDKHARAQYVYDRLLEVASHSQELFAWLDSHAAQPRRLLAANAIAASLDANQLDRLAANPLVKEIAPNIERTVIADEPTPLLLPPQLHEKPAQPGTVEWNIAKIRADQAWSAFGVTGQGAVVGIVDTGVQFDHPALVNSYRGNLGEGLFDHNYNWFDFVDGQPEPYDPIGHGTMGAGIISGDDSADNQIGVAPGANWIAVRACDFSCSDADLLAALDWMLAPTDLSNSNPDPTKAPDVMLGMWGGGGCDSFFLPSLQALRAAGILPMFAPGGSGPSCASVGSPAALPEAFAAGATDQDDVIAVFSSRGPGCGGVIKPDVSAPGVNIRTSNTGDGYYTTSGTSWSAAHTAGEAAMIISANPLLGLVELEAILKDTAVCIDNNQCGGDACPGANNVYGHGRIDVYEAVFAALSSLPYSDLPWLAEDPVTGTLPAGAAIAIDVSFDSAGLEPGTYTGLLGVQAGELTQDLVFVPVTLQVTTPAAPNLYLDPLSFSVTLPVSGVLTQTLTIANTGADLLTFSMYEVTGTKRMAAPPIPVLGPLQVLFSPWTSTEAGVDAGVREQLASLGKTRLIIYMHGLPDVTAAYAIPERVHRLQYVYDQMLATLSLSDDLYAWLLSQGAQPRRLLAANAIAATLDAPQLETALSFTQVRSVGLNGYAEILPAEPANTNALLFPMSLPDVVEWNIAKIRADETWSTFNITGQGAAVGVIDTGVLYTHNALVNQYRGNLGGGNFDHNYAWYDLINAQPVPYDDNGHGTFGTGLAVGDDGGVNQIGVAPGASWIAVKALDSGGGTTYEDLLAALDWMLAPTDVYGNDPDPAMAPQVVLNMWGISGCDHTFDATLDIYRAANILPVFAPGGEGPSCGLVASPAADPDSLSAGATDNNDNIGPFSARGPSCFDGSIKPDVTAPGVNVRSSTNDGNNSYQVWSGASFSTAHLAGAAALLFSADPTLSLDQLEQILFDTAVCKDPAFSCTGDDSCPGPNNTYGYGRIDVFEAVSATLGTTDVPWLVAGPLSGELPPSGVVVTPVRFDATGLAPGAYYAGIAVDSNDPDTPHLVLPVTLTVTSACQPAIIVGIEFDPSYTGEVMTFTAIATGTLPIDYSWFFDDGTLEFGAQVTHIFDTPGNHSAVLYADNVCGEPAWAQLWFLIEQRSWLPLIR